MAGADVNAVTLVCRLTRDPDLRAAGSTSVCALRVAFDTRRKDPSTGEWGTKPNYVDVTVWGAQGENCSRFLSKGRQIAVLGRLEWREWTDNNGNKRQAHEIVAETVQFLGGRDDAAGAPAGSSTPRSDVPADTTGFTAPATPAAPAEDDIPF